MVVKLRPQFRVVLRSGAVEDLVTCICSTGERGGVGLSRLQVGLVDNVKKK